MHELDTEGVVRLLLRDVASLGAWAQADVRAMTERVVEFAHERWEAGDDRDDVQSSFDQRVVDGCQEEAQEIRRFTTWPPCPRHPQHPLWYEVSDDAWCCPRDGSVVAPLGELLAPVRAETSTDSADVGGNDSEA